MRIKIQRNNNYRIPMVLNLLILVVYIIHIYSNLGYSVPDHLLMYNLVLTGCCTLAIIYNILKTQKIDLEPFLLILGFVGIPLLSSFLNSGLYLRAIYDICEWPFLFFLTYQVTKQANIKLKNLKNLTIVSIVVIACLCTVLISEFFRGNTLVGATIRPTYFLFTFIPLAYISMNKRSATILFLLVTLVVFLSAKRTGIIACVGGLVFYYLFDAYNNGSIATRWKKLFKLLVIGIILFVLFVIIDGKYNLNVINRFKMLSYDEGSGRFSIWNIVFSEFKNSGLLKMLIGHGYHAVATNLNVISSGRDILAHNDIVEYLYDCGLIGILLIFALYFRIIYLAWTMVKEKHRYLPAFSVFFVMFFCVSLFSYGICQSTTINTLMVFYAIILAERKKEKLNEDSKNKKCS